jgi:hypothetical protein
LREQAEDTLIIADGFYCRAQTEQLTNRQTTRTAELVSSALPEAAGQRAPLSSGTAP